MGGDSTIDIVKPTSVIPTLQAVEWPDVKFILTFFTMGMPAHEVLMLIYW